MSNDKLAAAFYPPRRWTLALDVPFAAEVITMNARGHWTNTHRQIERLRQRAQLAARTAETAMPHLLIASCVVYLRFPDKRRRDLQNYNATLKALIDGFIDVGLLPDDDTRHLVSIELRSYDYAQDSDPDALQAFSSERSRTNLSLVFVFEGYEIGDER